MKFRVEIASVPDRDEVVAEIWSDDDMVAEVYRASVGGFLLEIYGTESGDPWSFDLNSWVAALEQAKRSLA
jgi:hypothetical protein